MATQWRQRENIQRFKHSLMDFIKTGIAFALLIGSLNAAQIDVDWVDAATDEDNYVVEWSLASNYDPLVSSATIAANLETYSITGLDNNTLYYVRVYATSSLGDSANLDGSETTVPAAPTSLSAAQGSGSKVDLTWTAPTGGAASYKVEFKTSVSSTWNEFASGVTGVLDTVSGLDGSTSYDFRVRGTTAGGDGAYSNIDSVTTGTASPPLLEETFEGAVAVTGGTGTADSTGWVATSANNNFDYSSSPIAGTYSHQATDDGETSSKSISPAGTEVWLYFRFKGGAASTVADLRALTMVEAAAGVGLRINVRSNRNEIYLQHGTVRSESNIDNWPGASSDFSVERHVKIQWEKGTGSNGVARMWTSSDGTFNPIADREITTGDGNYNVDTVRLYGGSDAIIDNLYISDDEIGNNPFL